MKKLIVLLLILAAGFGIYLWFMSNLSAVDPGNTKQEYFVVEKGESARQIGTKLQEKGYIKNPTIFYLYLKFTGTDKKLQTGDFKFSKSMSTPTIAKLLTGNPIDIWVTIPEGMRADQIADILQEQIPTYDESWRGMLKTREGYLFPDTYLIPRTATIDQVLLIFKTNFDAKIASVGLTESSQNLPRIINIASLIERESLFDEDHPIVSSVIQNRLDLGMKLDIDATVQYALGKQPDGKWWKKVTSNDLAIISPYNTYKNAGLPPTPIANPGIDAIKAAMNPAVTDYLYYISDLKGHIHAAKTFEEHQRNINRYL